jgi:hypothetical protein
LDDNEARGPRGPSLGAIPVEGLLSLEPKPIRCRDCGRKIGGAAEAVHVTGRVRRDFSELTPGEFGAWCDDCSVLTVYVRVA